MRGFAGAYTACCQWLFQFIIARTTPYMASNLGYGMFLLFGSFCALGGVFAFFCIPGAFLWILLVPYTDLKGKGTDLELPLIKF